MTPRARTAANSCGRRVHCLGDGVAVDGGDGAVGRTRRADSNAAARCDIGQLGRVNLCDCGLVREIDCGGGVFLCHLNRVAGLMGPTIRVAAGFDIFSL